MMKQDEFKRAMADSLWDGLGFIIGGCGGMLLGRAFGFNLFEPGYNARSMTAIILVGLGCGLGLRLIRRFRAQGK